MALIGNIRPIKEYKIIENTTSWQSENPSEYLVTFRITDACNLKCDYCHWHNGINYSTDKIFKTIDKLFEFFKIKNYRTITLYFHGGEPSYHKNIISILEYIRDVESKEGINTIIEFQTNLSLDDYSPFYKLVNTFSVSYHYLELLDKKLLDKFEENLYKLPTNQLLNLDIMLENIEEPQLDIFYSNIKRYLKMPFKNSEMIYGFCHYKYNEVVKIKHIEFYKKHNISEQKYLIDDKLYTTNDLFKDGLNCKGLLCNAGKDNIIINGDGNIFICGIDMTNYTNRCMDTKPFANIIDEVNAIQRLVILTKTGTRCRWEYCGGDFYIPKSIK